MNTNYFQDIFKTKMAHYFQDTFIGGETAPATRAEAHALAQHWADQGECDEDDAHEMADAWADRAGLA